MIKELRIKKSGFTLVEVVVALGIFAIATTYSVSIFVQSNQVQKRTANEQRLQSDARFVVEVMAREVRLGHLDYAYYAGQGINLAAMPLTQDGAILAVRDADNNQLLFRRAASAEVGRYVVQVFSGGSWLDITPEDLNVVRLSFYISPSADPLVWSDVLVDYPSDQQPLVTMVLATESLHEDVQGTSNVSYLQTTVTERKYAR